MPRITPIHWKVLENIFLEDGFVFKRQVGSHRSYTKSGILRPVVIPAHNEVDEFVILTNMRTAGMTRERYFELLNKIK